MWTFRAMNTEVTVAAPRLGDSDGEKLAEQVASIFADTERRFSRFLAGSELARLNRATSPVRVSRELMELLRAARDHVATSRGVFDPAIGGALEAAGYDRSFAPGALDTGAPVRPASRARFDEVVLDEHAYVVVRPPHVHLDLGGFLKGRTVDRAAKLVPSPGLVSAGGDAALRGDGPDGHGWLVDIEDPANAARVLATLRVRDRAVATSAPNRRRWRTGAAHAHHLIDPRTAAPAVSDLAQVTVLAPTAEQADVAAKVAFVLGAHAGTAFVAARPELAAVLVTTAGAVHLIGAPEVADA